MLQLGGMLNILMLFKCIIHVGLGQRPHSLSNFRNFLEKKTTILPSFGSHFERFLGHWKEQSC